MDGILNINKPLGMTSFKVVSRVKRITGERHTGHAGTLDPAASGVLPVCLGKATRIIEYLFDETKTYLAEVEFGVVTDSYDSEGAIISTSDPRNVTAEKIEAALSGFRGEIMQVPPMYSALKHGGQPLYKLARTGVEVERKPRRVHISSIEIKSWQPPVATLEIDCGKGTYIRSLAHDLGTALGCGAYMKSLVRKRVGPFKIEDAATLEELEESFKTESGSNHLFPIDYPLSGFISITVSDEQKTLLLHGSNITVEGMETEERTLGRAYSEDGRFIGMIERQEDGLWKPHKIFIQE